MADIKNQVEVDRFTKVSDIGDYFISFVLDLAPKSNSKLPWIHHLSYLRDRSVNCYILKKWGALEYTIFDETKQEIIGAGLGGTMVIRDLTDAF